MSDEGLTDASRSIKRWLRGWERLCTMLFVVYAEADKAEKPATSHAGEWLEEFQALPPRVVLVMC
jgi:hypothetical protein